MKRFLKRIGIIQSFRIELAIESSNLIEYFDSKMDNGSPNLLFSFIERFRFNDKKYKGKINNNTIRLRKKTRFFYFRNGYPIATMTLTNKKKKTIINLTLSGYQYKLTTIIFLIFIPLALSLILIFSFRLPETFVGSTFLIFAFLSSCMITFEIKNSIKEFKSHLDIDFNKCIELYSQ